MGAVTAVKQQTKVKRKNTIAYFLLVPSIIVFAIFTFWPFFYTVYLSFFDWNMISADKEFVGFQNYIDVLADPNTYKITGNTFLYIALLLLLNCVIPYVFAFVIDIILKKWNGFYKGALFLPAFISLVVGSILFTWILNPVSGPLAIIFSWFGLEIPIWTKAEGKINAQTWNGGVSDEQLTWLQGVLEKSAQRNEKVVVLAHMPVYPANEHNVWNDEEVIKVLEGTGNVVAYFNGHNHAGNYGVQNGIHYVNLKGMVDTADTTAYSIVRVYKDRLEVDGYGREIDRVLEIQ